MDPPPPTTNHTISNPTNSNPTNSAVLAITTAGFPACIASLAWIDEVIAKAG